jgi:Ca2+-binding EF-hand superfamily protein
LIDKKIEKAKKVCTHRPNFNVPDSFHKIDVNERGIIDLSALKKFLQKNGFHPTDSELSWIFARFDRKLNGFISYEEFEKEIMPQSQRLVDISYTFKNAKY